MRTYRDLLYMTALAMASGAGVDHRGGPSGFATSRIHAKAKTRRKMARASRKANR